jgi:hypothetical protein
MCFVVQFVALPLVEEDQTLKVAETIDRNREGVVQLPQARVRMKNIIKLDYH